MTVKKLLTAGVEIITSGGQVSKRQGYKGERNFSI